jgi:hypothetical protein
MQTPSQSRLALEVRASKAGISAYIIGDTSNNYAMPSM